MWSCSYRWRRGDWRHSSILLTLALLTWASPAIALSDDRPLSERMGEILGGAPPEGQSDQVKVFPSVNWPSILDGLGSERRSPSLGLVGAPSEVRGVRVSRDFDGEDGGRWSLKWTVYLSRSEAFKGLVGNLSLSSMSPDLILSSIEAGLTTAFGDRAVLRRFEGRTKLCFLRDNIVVYLTGYGAAATRVTALGRLIDDAIVRESARPSLDFQGNERPRLKAEPRRVAVGERVVLRITGGETGREPWRVRWAEDSKVIGRFKDGTYHWTASEPGVHELSGYVYDTRGRCGRVSVRVVVREAAEPTPKPAPEPAVILPESERVTRLRKEFDLDPEGKGKLKLFPLAILDRVPMLTEQPRLNLEPKPDGPEVSGTLEYVRSKSDHLLVRYEVWSSRRKAVDALLAAVSVAPVPWEKQLARLRRLRNGRGYIGLQSGDATARTADFVRENVRVHVEGTGEYSRTVIVVADVLDDHIRAGDPVESLGFTDGAAPKFVTAPGPVRTGSELEIRLVFPQGYCPRAYAVLWKGEGPRPKELKAGQYRFIPKEPGSRRLKARYMDSSGHIADLTLDVSVSDD